MLNAFDRTLTHPQVHLDGVLAHTHESHSGSTFNEIAVAGTGVTTLTLEGIGLTSNEWLSIIEVGGATRTPWVSCSSRILYGSGDEAFFATVSRHHDPGGDGAKAVVDPGTHRESRVDGHLGMNYHSSTGFPDVYSKYCTVGRSPFL